MRNAGCEDETVVLAVCYHLEITFRQILFPVLVDTELEGKASVTEKRLGRFFMKNAIINSDQYMLEQFRRKLCADKWFRIQSSVGRTVQDARWREDSVVCDEVLADNRTRRLGS